MATRGLTQPLYCGNNNHASREFIGGNEQPRIKEAATQSWGAGALVYQDAGTIKIATAATQLLGQHLRAASGVTDNIVENLAVIRPGDRFWMNIYDGTPASAVFALDDLGERRVIVVNSGKFHVSTSTTIATSTTALPSVLIVGFHPDDAVGDIYPRVLAEFNQLVIATDGDPSYWLQGAS